MAGIRPITITVKEPLQSPAPFIDFGIFTHNVGTDALTSAEFRSAFKNCGFRGSENLGKYWELDRSAAAAQKPWCRECDWECWRDPSELTGPFLELTRAPLSLAKRFAGDEAFRRLWWSDLRYHRACGFFDLQTPPDYERMAATAGVRA